ncbi:SEC23-interacting protein [Papilio xuthus]|uniref:SEC23-interacting protein n=1 Tax=Papilio xuthus TaxID=66420 RepID=A0A194Q4P4_PAPXU|nr:SEC23-interacting protein [Papilio xuthus]
MEDVEAASSDQLREEYKHGILTGEWHRRLILPNGELVVMHGPGVMVHFLQTNAADAFSSSSVSIKI